MISVCIPVLNRYDCLAQEISSLAQGVVKPDAIHIIDNGGTLELPEGHSFRGSILIHVWKPGKNIGVAASWNHFLRITHDIRVIANDDLVFAPETLKILVEHFDDNALISPDSIIGGNAYSCFMLSDKLVREIGFFDESISPNYAYFEDSDHCRRLVLKGYGIKPASNCPITHGLSSTLKAYTQEQMTDHHRRFEIAKANYSRKWGGLPGSETYSVPYNGAV